MEGPNSFSKKNDVSYLPGGRGQFFFKGARFMITNLQNMVGIFLKKVMYHILQICNHECGINIYLQISFSHFLFLMALLKNKKITNPERPGYTKLLIGKGRNRIFKTGY